MKSIQCSLRKKQMPNQQKEWSFKRKAQIDYLSFKKLSFNCIVFQSWFDSFDKFTDYLISFLATIESIFKLSLE